MKRLLRRKWSAGSPDRTGCGAAVQMRGARAKVSFRGVYVYMHVLLFRGGSAGDRSYRRVMLVFQGGPGRRGLGRTP